VISGHREVEDEIAGSDINESPTAADKIEADEDQPTTGQITDLDNILETLSLLAARQKAELLGQAGWIAYGERVHAPMRQFLASETLFSETWFHVDSTGVVHEQISLIQSPNGDLLQLVLFHEGRVVNLLRGANGFEIFSDMPKEPAPIYIVASQVRDLFEEMRPTGSSIVTANLTEGMEYVVTAESREPEPVVNDPRFPGQSVIGARVVSIFEWETGQLLGREVSFLVDDVWVIEETKDSIHITFHAELPDEIVRQFNHTVALVAEEQNK
jgi:hypothetical protein